MENTMVANLTGHVLTVQFTTQRHEAFNVEFNLGSEYTFVDGFYLPIMADKFDLHVDRHVRTIAYASRVLSEVKDKSIDMGDYLEALAKRLKVKRFQFNTNGGMDDSQAVKYEPRLAHELADRIIEDGFDITF